MITIDKAIRDLQARVDGEFCIKGVDDCEDIKLGIEGLKEILRNRPIFFRSHRNIHLLPGETKD